MNDYDIKLDQSKLVALLSKKEGIGELLESVLNQVLELQMSEHLGAERHQRSSEREGYRNGYRARQLYTRVGRLNLRVPQTRDGSGLEKASEAIGRSVGGLTSKIHAKVDALGQLVKVVLTPSQVHESQVAEAIFSNKYCDYFLADKAYDIDNFRVKLKLAGIHPVIPSKLNRLYPTEHDKHIYKERNIVARFFQKIKRFRQIATRYDKTARMYLTGITFVSVLMALKL